MTLLPDELSIVARSRSALLDALEALEAHLSALVVIGAQAIYLRTETAPFALAAMTKDSDLALDTRALADEPRLEAAMEAAGFRRHPTAPQPGTWLRSDEVPIDLMVPAALAGTASRRRRGARIPPHARFAARQAVGIEATLVDFSPMEITGLDPADLRSRTANVAGPASLLVAKTHKLSERRDDPSRLADKDAHDVYRLLVAISTAELAASLARLRADPFAGRVTAAALVQFAQLFAAGPAAVGSAMTGRAEEGVGDPAFASQACAVLARELLDAVG